LDHEKHNQKKFEHLNVQKYLNSSVVKKFKYNRTTAEKMFLKNVDQSELFNYFQKKIKNFEQFDIDDDNISYIIRIN